MYRLGSGPAFLCPSGDGVVFRASWDAQHAHRRFLPLSVEIPLHQDWDRRQVPAASKSVQACTSRDRRDRTVRGDGSHSWVKVPTRTRPCKGASVRSDRHIAGVLAHNSLPYHLAAREISFGYVVNSGSLAKPPRGLSFHLGHSRTGIGGRARAEGPGTSF